MRFIHGVWIDAGRAGAFTSLDQHEVVFDTPHAASPVEGTVCQECEALAGCFSVSRRERVTGGAGMRVSRVKANVRGTRRQSVHAYECVHVCLAPVTSKWSHS